MTGANYTTAKTLNDLAHDAIVGEWESWDAGLPDDAHTWDVGAVYVRESGATSLVGDAPSTQLRYALNVMAAERIYVPREHVYFEQATGTEIAARREFQALLAQAMEGKFKALGVYVSSRLFRNMEEAIMVKRQLLLHGVQLYWPGRPKMDDRDPSAWAMERQMEMADELHSRQTGWFVGRAKEYLSSNGHPQGPLPEGFVVAERGPSLPGGRRGRAISWTFNEPLATHIKDGARRYLAGDTYKSLERWSAGSDFKGRTPNGVEMDVDWWNATLTNPKYAGLHKPTHYQGYKPGKQSPKREHRTRHSELVPCLLPALISAEDFYRIRELGVSRWKGPKWRKRYYEDLTAGVLYDADCGHRLHVKQRSHHGRPSRTRVLCASPNAHAPSARSYCIDDAVAELDELLATLRFDDDALITEVQARLEESEINEAEPPIDPRAAELRAAIHNLTDPAFDDMRKQLEVRLAAMEVRATRPRRKRSPVQAAIEDLKHWAHVWETASIREKNGLLRAAGLKVYVQRLPHKPTGRPKVRVKQRASRLAALRASEPAFASALAAALGNSVLVKAEPTLDNPASLWTYAVWDDTETSNAHKKRPTVFVDGTKVPTLRRLRKRRSLPIAA